MLTQELVSYEESVKWMRKQSEYAELVKLCYLDQDNLEAAKRFTASEEFQEVSNLLQLKNRTNPVQVLDLGCGNGIASYAFALLGCEVIAVDPDTSEDVGLMAVGRLCENIASGSITPIQGMAEALPFSDDTFDIVYERQALHHFSDLVQGLTECARVLKPGGLFLATREHVVDDAQQLELFLSQHVLHQKHGGENAYSLQHYITSLEQSGFLLVQQMGSMDSVINHFPTSNADVSRAIHRWITSKVGSTLSGLITQTSFAEKAYRRIRSMRDHSPGRLYSFLCTK